MKHAQDVIVQPLLTEKSTILQETKGVYCFKVNVDANKIEIRQAIEELWKKDKVKVASVRTSRVLGKVKRMGRFVGARPSWKKAWVKLAPGSKEIDFIEGA